MTEPHQDELERALHAIKYHELRMTQERLATDTALKECQELKEAYDAECKNTAQLSAEVTTLYKETQILKDENARLQRLLSGEMEVIVNDKHVLYRAFAELVVDYLDLYNIGAENSSLRSMWCDLRDEPPGPEEERKINHLSNRAHDIKKVAERGTTWWPLIDEFGRFRSNSRS